MEERRLHAFPIEPLSADFPFARFRHARLLANVALLRSTLLALRAEHHPDQPPHELLEYFHSRTNRCLNLLNS